MKTRTKSKKVGVRGAPVKHYWKDEFYLASYELALQGMSNIQIAKALGLPKRVFVHFVRNRSVLRDNLRKARKPATSIGVTEKTPEHGGCGERVIDYIYRRLPPDLQKLWEEIDNLTGNPDDDRKEVKGVAKRIEALFTIPGAKHARQALWLHALVAANFNANEACRKVNIGYETLRQWTRDKEFSRLLYAMKQMKKSFAESALWRLVAAGEPSIVKFVNTCLNPEDYNPAKKVELSGHVSSKHTIEINDKILSQVPLEQRKELLRQLEEAEKTDEDFDLDPIDIEAKAI